MGRRRRTDEGWPRAPLSIGLLGGFRLTVGSTPVADSAWRLSKAKSLVKLLAMAPQHRLPRDQVIDLLWPDLDPQAAANNLHQTLHAVRRALSTPEGSAELRLSHGLLHLHPSGHVEVDVDAFNAAASRARQSDDAALYHDAIARYTGDLLPDDRYEDWCAWRRESLRETYLALSLEVARRHEARGELNAAIEALQRAVAAEPTHEEAQVALMRLFAGTGRRDRAIRQYAVLTSALKTELDIEPDESSKRVYEAVLAGMYGDTVPQERTARAARAAEDDAPRHNLPIELTSFVGRESELEELKEQLLTHRLLTLTGVGGAGKTRLALRLGWEVLDRYPGGVWLANLAPLTDPALVPQTVMDALQLSSEPGRPVTDQLVEAVGVRKALIILDNCEHMLGACADLAFTLLTRCTEVRIVATSRSRLGVEGELTVPVYPLRVPSSGVTDLSEVLAIEAVQLFIERARFRQPSFRLTDDMVPAAVSICRRLEGIPLAIELAAGRMGAVSMEQIAERLANAFYLLSGGLRHGEARHQTLWAAIDWSYGLLTEGEKSLFRHLSVFEGGWLLSAAEDVCLDTDRENGSVLEPLSRLVDKSLVTVTGMARGDVRYRLLEPIRKYALEGLAAAGEETEIRLRHAAHYVPFADEVGRGLRGPDPGGWLEKADAEHDNVRSALHWSMTSGRVETGLRIAGHLWRFWFLRGHLDEGRAAVHRLLDEASHDPSIPPEVLGVACNAAGSMAYFQSDMREAAHYYDRSLRLRRACGDEEGVASALSNLGLVMKERGELQRAIELFEEAEALAARLGNTASVASAVGNLGILMQEQGEFLRARELHERGLAIAREAGSRSHLFTGLNNLAAVELELGNLAHARALCEENLQRTMEIDAKRSTCVAHTNLGHVARKQGCLGEAFEHYIQALTLAREQGEKKVVSQALDGMAMGFVTLGATDLAVTVFSAASAVRADSGITLGPVDIAAITAALEEASRSLGDGYRLAWLRGQSLPLDEVIAAALSATPQPLPTT